MASKRNVWQIVQYVVGPAVGAIVAVLLETLLESGGTSAPAILKAWPALLLGVAAGVGVAVTRILRDRMPCRWCPTTACDATI